MDRLTQIVAMSDQHLITELLIKWNKASKNEELFEVTEAFKRIFAYTNSLELELYAMESEVSRSIKDKNRAIVSRRRIEIELNKATKDLELKKKQLKIFTGE